MPFKLGRVLAAGVACGWGSGRPVAGGRGVLARSLLKDDDDATALGAGRR